MLTQLLQLVLVALSLFSQRLQIRLVAHRTEHETQLELLREVLHARKPKLARDFAVNHLLVRGRKAQRHLRVDITNVLRHVIFREAVRDELQLLRWCRPDLVQAPQPRQRNDAIFIQHDERCARRRYGTSERPAVVELFHGREYATRVVLVDGENVKPHVRIVLSSACECPFHALHEVDESASPRVRNKVRRRANRKILGLRVAHVLFACKRTHEALDDIRRVHLLERDVAILDRNRLATFCFFSRASLVAVRLYVIRRHDQARILSTSVLLSHELLDNVPALRRSGVLLNKLCKPC